MKPLHLPTARPSGLERIHACKASLFYSTFVEHETSDAASDGTRLHQLAESTVHDWIVGRRSSDLVSGEPIVDEYLDFLRLLMSESHSLINGAQKMFTTIFDSRAPKTDLCGMEFPVSLEHVNPLFRNPGTVDFWQQRNGHLTVVDLKTGNGKMVAAANNKQLQGYAVALVDLFAQGLRVPFVDQTPVNIKTVDLVIVQPRAWDGETVKRASYTIEDVNQWREEIASIVAPFTDDDAAIMANAGDHCHWCSGASVCPAVLADIFALSSIERDYLDGGEQIAAMLEKCEGVEQALKDLKVIAKNMISSGQTVPGYSIKTTRRTDEKWFDDDGIMPALRGYKELGYDVLKEGPRTPKQVRKILKKEFEVLEDQVLKEERENTVLVKDKAAESSDEGWL